MSHILVFRGTEYPMYWVFMTEYPIYLYFRGQNISYTGGFWLNIPYAWISEEIISHILVIQRTECPIYWLFLVECPIYWYFRWQNAPYSYKYVCVINIDILQWGCWNSAVPTETVLEHEWTKRSPVAIRYCGIGPPRWRKTGLLPYVVEQAGLLPYVVEQSRTRCCLYSRIWRYGDRTTCDEFYRVEGRSPYSQEFPEITTKWETRQYPSSLEPYCFS
jgi:hypothetical protein